MKILEENHYYPFGLKHEKYNSAVFDFILTGSTSSLSNVARSKNQFKYNGQEFQDELELNMTAMDFRQYDNALGRFHGVDLLAELDYSGSPYSFGFNNPVYFSDPSGLFPTREAAMAHIEMYGLTNATVSLGDIGWVVSNEGYNFYQSASGSMWLSFANDNGVFIYNLGGGGNGSSSGGASASSGNGGYGSSNNGFGSSSGSGMSGSNVGGGGSSGSRGNINNINIGWISQYNNQVPNAGDFACKRACYLMMQNAGFNPMRGMVNGIYIAVESGGTIRATPNMSVGINYLNEQLRNGNPVIVGVARDLDGYRTKNLNGDHTTDHFIIIYGMQNGEYIFLDPWTRNSASGASPNNLLILLNGIYRGNRSGQNYNLMLSWIGKNY